MDKLKEKNEKRRRGRKNKA